ncbi:Uncharacterised protein [Mycobacteroides abscessus subsp. abscessus]|nr:Uncharacterised protein [Mycobacteroides abscessus subsp. abscessus]
MCRDPQSVSHTNQVAGTKTQMGSIRRPIYVIECAVYVEIPGGTDANRTLVGFRSDRLGQSAGNHSAISRAADSGESEPCTRFS